MSHKVITASGSSVGAVAKSRRLDHFAIGYLVALAVYDILADVFAPYLPPEVLVYLFIIIEAAFLMGLRWIQPRFSRRGLYDGLFWFVLWFVALMYISALIPSGDVVSDIKSLYYEGLLPLMIVAYLLIEPVVSELYFRAVIFQRLVGRSRPAAYLASSLLWSFLLTAPEDLGGLATALVMSLLGIILAYAYERGGFTSSLIIHAIFSALYTVNLVIIALG